MEEAYEKSAQEQLFLCFSTTDSLLSRSIRWATRSHISHVVLAYHCQTINRYLVMESAGGGFRILPWETWRDENTPQHLFKVRVSTRVWRRCMSQFSDILGTKYDVVRAVVNFAELAIRRFGGVAPSSTTRFPHPKRVLCSDAIAVFFRHLGMVEFARPHQWTPVNFLKFATANPLFQPVLPTFLDRAVTQIHPLRRRKSPPTLPAPEPSAPSPHDAFTLSPELSEKPIDEDFEHSTLDIDYAPSPAASAKVSDFYTDLHPPPTGLLH